MDQRSTSLRRSLIPAAAACLLLCGCQAPPAATGADPAPEEAAPVVARVTLGSGLTIEDLRLGTGEAVVPDSTITVAYTGELADGTVFDRAEAAQPRTFPLARLIEGWRQGLVGMRVGGIRRLLVPADLAYGAAGQQGLGIPPGADLVFRIELLSVTPGPNG